MGPAFHASVRIYTYSLYALLQLDSLKPKNKKNDILPESFVMQLR